MDEESHVFTITVRQLHVGIAYRETYEGTQFEAERRASHIWTGYCSGADVGRYELKLHRKDERSPRVTIK